MFKCIAYCHTYFTQILGIRFWNGQKTMSPNLDRFHMYFMVFHWFFFVLYQGNGPIEIWVPSQGPQNRKAARGPRFAMSSADVLSHQLFRFQNQRSSLSSIRLSHFMFGQNHAKSIKFPWNVWCWYCTMISYHVQVASGFDSVSISSEAETYLGSSPRRVQWLWWSGGAAVWCWMRSSGFGLCVFYLQQFCLLTWWFANFEATFNL